MDHTFLTKALSQKILPAVTFESVEDALPVTEALLKAGLRIMEVPMRTFAAAGAISAIRKNFPEMYAGAGTLLTPAHLKKANDAGARFGLSAGLNKGVCEEAKRMQFPFIPGVMTPSEIELAYELGCNIQKLFPAQQVGGAAFLKAMQGPYEHLKIQFIPMGGVNLENLEAYIKLNNVIAVGGTWMATPEAIAQKNYPLIEEEVTRALQITGKYIAL